MSEAAVHEAISPEAAMKRGKAAGVLGAKLSFAIPLVIFMIGVAVMIAYRPWRHMEINDSAVYDYMAQSILRGEVPYRDAIDSKGPGSLYISAVVMAIGKAVGVQDIIAVRFFYALLVGALCLVSYFVAETYLQSRIAGIIAFALPLMSDHFAVLMISGTRPKVPMILFGLLTLLLIAKDRPFWAGVSSMMACLCWQPGLAFTGVALLMFSRYFTSWRNRRALKVLAGAAIPFAIVIGYFYFVGALDDLWTWTVRYNYTVYLPEANVSPRVALEQVWRLAKDAMGANIFWVEASIAGFVVYALSRVWTRIKERNLVGARGLFRDAILIPPVIHLGFCIVNWQGEEALIPFFPFIGIFAGYLVVTIVSVLSAIPFFRRSAAVVRVIKWSPAIPLLIILLSVINHARRFEFEPGRTLQDQQAAYKVVSDQLGPDDKIYVHGTLELLVFLHRSNMNPYIFLPYGKDEYIGSKVPGGFRAIIDKMEAQKPKVVALSRMRTLVHSDDLLEWASSRYETIPLEFGHNQVYVRKQEQPN